MNVGSKAVAPRKIVKRSEFRVGGNWECPYCRKAQVLSEDRFVAGWHRLFVKESVLQTPAFFVRAIVCANADCREISLFAMLSDVKLNSHHDVAAIEKTAGKWTLLPVSNAKPQPDFIPKPIRDDYYEASAIRDLSPKASATLIRRCLQGMLRDFCGISMPTLAKEIAMLRSQVDAGNAPPGVQHESIDAIDHVRKIGNIGAHMEMDINIIVDVEPEEAQLLIGLAEMLFEEWYIARQARQERLAALSALSADKQQDRKLTAAIAATASVPLLSSLASAVEASQQPSQPPPPNQEPST